MNRYKQISEDCKFFAKAYQNVQGSSKAMARFAADLAVGDETVLAALFCHAVVRYAKPFVETQTATGRKRRLKARDLARREGFDRAMHEHLLELRHTLIAHDDLASINPRVFKATLEEKASGARVTAAVQVASKTLAYPDEIKSVERLARHIASCAEGLSSQLTELVLALASEGARNPEDEQEATEWSRDLSHFITEGDGRAIIEVPQFSEAPDVPDFSDFYESLRYELFERRWDLSSPVIVRAADGSTLVVAPHGMFSEINCSLGGQLVTGRISYLHFISQGYRRYLRF